MLFTANKKKDASAPSQKSLLTDWQKRVERSHSLPSAVFLTPVKITETKDAYTFFIIKQGLVTPSLCTHLTGDVLTVSADVQDQQYVEQGNGTRFSKSFSLPGNADRNRISCSYEDGTIQLVLCKIRRNEPAVLWGRTWM
jgi:HSP20 family molecular chaperone IbpA